MEVECLDARFLPEGSLFNAATETRFRCRYAGGVELLCETEKSSVGARFEGSDGMVQVGYAGLFTRAESLKTSKIGAGEIHLYSSDNHVRKFRVHQEPAGAGGAVEVGHRSSSICHLGNIAIRLWKQGKKVLRWDPSEERFTNDDEANAMLARPMRGPWTL